MTTLAEIAPNCYRIFVEELQIEAKIGIYPAEIRSPQSVLVTMEVWTPRGGCDEKIERTANYDDLCDAARSVLLAGHVNLAETAADRILERIRQLPGVRAARVCCRKPHAVPGARAAGVEALWIAPEAA